MDAKTISMLFYHFLPTLHALADPEHARMKIAEIENLNDPFGLRYSSEAVPRTTCARSAAKSASAVPLRMSGRGVQRPKIKGTEAGRVEEDTTFYSEEHDCERLDYSPSSPSPEVTSASGSALDPLL